MLHERVQQILLDVQEPSENKYTTCTLASVLDVESVKPMSLLLVAEGYRTSVPAYTSNHDGRVLKISTIHVEGHKLMEIITNTYDHCKPTGLKSRKVWTEAFDVENSVTKLDKLISRRLVTENQGGAHLMYSVDGHETKLKAQFSKNMHSITFSLASPQNTEIDRVQGLYNLEELTAHYTKPSHFSDSQQFGLTNFDCPGDEDYAVTCVLMSVEQANGSLLTLCKLVAAELDDNPIRKEKGWELKTIRFRNYKIYQLIEGKFCDQILSTLSDVKKEKWRKESSPFVVLSDISSVHPDSADLNAIIPTTHQSDSGRTIYTFSHPISNNMYFAICEPASPSDVVASPGINEEKHDYKMVRNFTSAKP